MVKEILTEEDFRKAISEKEKVVVLDKKTYLKAKLEIGGFSEKEPKKKEIIKDCGEGGYTPIEASNLVEMIAEKVKIKGTIKRLKCSFSRRYLGNVSIAILKNNGEEIVKEIPLSDFKVSEKMALYTARCIYKDNDRIIQVVTTNNGKVFLRYGE